VKNFCWSQYNMGTRSYATNLIPAPFLFLILLAHHAVAQVAPAQITGPIEAAAHGDPSRNSQLNPSAIDVEGIRYIEREYFIAGTANRYNTPDMQTGEILDSGHPYKTRFIVRRPASDAHFNGSVVVEWNNVTGGRDLDIDWWQSGAHFIREGYAFIAVSAQRVGVDHLRQWSALRYGDLDVTNGRTVMDDALSYDIFSAVAKAIVREGESLPSGAVDILEGLRPSVVIATGHSQSAGRLANYINHVHGLDPVFDGFMVHGGGGRIRDDQPVKVFKIMAETDMAARAANPQPNSSRFRQWEVAGSSHVDIPFELEFAKMVELENGQPVFDPAPRQMSCDRPAFSHVPFRHAMNAAFEHLSAWIVNDVPPPVAPPLQLVQATAPMIFARDEQGNVLGGIRLAAHAVPTATNTGMNTGDAFCRLYGSHEPFDSAELRRRYPTQEVYLNAVRAVVEQNLVDGYILPADAEETLAQAAASGVGNW
jgi:hypothetical protein